MLTVGQMSRITKEVMLRLPPSLTTKEALAFREEVSVEIAEMKAQGIVPELPCDFGLDDEPPTYPSAPPATLPLDPHATTLAAIREPLTADERLWLARMIDAHGEEQVITMWPSYCAQIEYVRNF